MKSWLRNESDGVLESYVVYFFDDDDEARRYPYSNALAGVSFTRYDVDPIGPWDIDIVQKGRHVASFSLGDGPIDDAVADTQKRRLGIAGWMLFKQAYDSVLSKRVRSNPVSSMGRPIVGLLDEHCTPSGAWVVERWLPRGFYAHGPRGAVRRGNVEYDALLWINPETKRFWALGRQPDQRPDRVFWYVSAGEAEHDIERPDERGPWFTRRAESYEERVIALGDDLTVKVPLASALAVHEMMPRFRKLEQRMPRAARGRR